MKIDTTKPQTLVLPILSLLGDSVTFPNSELQLNLSKEHHAVIEAIKKVDNYVLIAFYTGSDPISYEVNTFYEIGLIGRLIKCSKIQLHSDDSSQSIEDDGYRVTIETLTRAEIYETAIRDSIYMAKTMTLPYQLNTDKLYIGMVNQMNASLIKKTRKASISVFPEPEKVKWLITPRLESNCFPEIFVFADKVASYMRMSIEQKFEYLSLSGIDERLSYLSKKIDEIGLTEKSAITEKDVGNLELIKQLGMPEKVEQKVIKEINHLAELPSDSNEHSKLRTYIKWLTDIPWKNETEDRDDLDFASETLDSEHYGLEKVKTRILEHIAVKIMCKKNPSTIICLSGPPGVGKTTLAKSIATALGRNFVKFSLGGVRDEADIRGFQRTYVSSAPGRIIQGMKQAKTINPVFLLDEIDKLSTHHHRGNPAAALLEVLDPAQNKHFRDHYLEEEYDLSNVMFIATANVLEDIPEPLRDRMEVITVSSYTEVEKFEIAKKHLIKKQIEEHGLNEEQIIFEDEAIKAMIQYYTLEAGVRELNRTISTICRKSVVTFLDSQEKQIITKEQLVPLLGKHKFEHTIANRESRVGVATGLAYTSFGGDILMIEVSYFKGSGELILTGKLGDVMKESAKIALSYVRNRAKDFGVDEKIFKNNDIHIHVPDGATPKDGPSAGTTLITAIVSALTNRKIRPDVGMTGELTLQGLIKEVGGIKEKAISAHRSGLTTIIIPKENEKDIDDIPQTVQENLTIMTVSEFDEVLEIAFE